MIILKNIVCCIFVFLGIYGRPAAIGQELQRSKRAIISNENAVVNARKRRSARERYRDANSDSDQMISDSDDENDVMNSKSDEGSLTVKDEMNFDSDARSSVSLNDDSDVGSSLSARNDDSDEGSDSRSLRNDDSDVGSDSRSANDDNDEGSDRLSLNDDSDAW